MEINDARLYKYVAQRLKELRTERGLTQGELAKLVVVARSTVANIENELQRPTLALLYALGNALDVKMSDVLPPISNVLSANQPEPEPSVNGWALTDLPKTAQFLKS